MTEISMIRVLVMMGLLIGLFVLPGKGYALDAKQVYEKVSRSIYSVYGLDKNQRKRVALASGVAVTKHLIVTNCHVARESDYFQIKYKKKYYLARLIFENYLRDLCLLKVDDVTLKPVEFRDSKNVKIGETVFAIGNPYGLEKTISQGIISNKHNFQDAALLQTDAMISFGSSGGGLFDDSGKLIGITRAGHRYKDIAFASPSEWIAELAEQKKPLVKPLMDHHIEMLGEYGKDKITLYRFDKECFLYFVSKKQPEIQQAAMIWFPAYPLKVYLIPISTVVEENLRSMLDLGFFDKGKLAQAEQSTSLPQMLFPTSVVLQTFSENPEKTFAKSNNVQLQSPNLYHHNEVMTMEFGMLGFTKANDAFKQQCLKAPVED